MRTWLWTKSPQLVLHKILELSPKKWPKMGNCHKKKESGVGATSPNFLGGANFWSSLLVAVPLPLLPCKLFSKLTQMSSYQLQFQLWFVFIAFFREVDQCQEKWGLWQSDPIFLVTTMWNVLLPQNSHQEKNYKSSLKKRPHLADDPPLGFCLYLIMIFTCCEIYFCFLWNWSYFPCILSLVMNILSISSTCLQIWCM